MVVVTPKCFKCPGYLLASYTKVPACAWQLMAIATWLLGEEVASTMWAVL